MKEQSPMGKVFEEIVAGYRPCDSFDIELNVPLALAGNPNLVLPVVEEGTWFDRCQLVMATYRTPYPGSLPKRYQAFVLSPKENLVTNYPVTSENDVKFIRSDDERYFTSLKDTVNCYKESCVRNVPVHDIAGEFGGRTAQEMIDYFKSFDVEPRNSFPTFPSDGPGEAVTFYLTDSE